MASVDKVRFAVLGLGNIAQTAVLPGFQNAPNAELVAFVSGSEPKRQALAARYHLHHSGGYDQLEAVLAQSGADAVYIALPNHLHEAFTLRAARAGVHVLCEKPMALSDEACRAMIAATQQNGVKLMIAYRLHFDAANLHAIGVARSGQIGSPRLFTSLLTHDVRPGDIRTRADLGGGALFDAGVYPINAARYLFAAEPVEVLAAVVPGQERMPGVDQTAAAVLAFPGGRLAQFIVSQRAAAVSSYRLVGESGDLRLAEAYQYARPMQLTVSTSGQRETRRFPPHDQFGAQISYFSQCVRDGLDPEPGGEEGRADVRIVRALIDSALEGRPVRITPVDSGPRPDPAQRIDRPAVSVPEPIWAPSPQLES